MTMSTLYDILGIQVGASFQDIRKAYLKKVVSEHPDKGGTAESFEKIQHAYKTLSNPGERTIYDETVLGQRVAEEDESRCPPVYHSADGVTVEYHGQQHSSRKSFYRKGGSRAGQREECDILVDLNRVIEERHKEHLENPTEPTHDLAMAYVERAVYHLNQNKPSHALFDAYEAQHIFPDILTRDHVPSVQQVALFLDTHPERQPEEPCLQDTEDSCDEP